MIGVKLDTYRKMYIQESLRNVNDIADRQIGNTRKEKESSGGKTGS